MNGKGFELPDRTAATTTNNANQKNTPNKKE